MQSTTSKLTRKISALTGAVLAGALFGCADGRVNQLADQLSQTRKELKEIREIQAEHTAGINDLRASIGQLSGKVDETQYLAKGKTEELQRTLEMVSSRVPPPAGVDEELLNSDDEKISRINSPAAQSYRQSLQLLRTGSFEPARLGFETFINENPGTAFTDNANYWMGVTLVKLGQPDRAVGAFSEVFQKFPAEDFVAPALLELARTFNSMDSKNEARLTLEKLVEEHPRSRFATAGRELLAELRPAPKAVVKKKR